MLRATLYLDGKKLPAAARPHGLEVGGLRKAANGGESGHETQRLTHGRTAVHLAKVAQRREVRLLLHHVGHERVDVEEDGFLAGFTDQFNMHALPFENPRVHTGPALGGLEDVLDRLDCDFQSGLGGGKFLVHGVFNSSRDSRTFTNAFMAKAYCDGQN